MFFVLLFWPIFEALLNFEMNDMLSVMLRECGRRICGVFFFGVRVLSKLTSYVARNIVDVQIRSRLSDLTECFEKN